jgi:hypothetical protein
MVCFILLRQLFRATRLASASHDVGRIRSIEISVRRQFAQVQVEVSDDSEPPPSRFRRGMHMVTVVPCPISLPTSSRNERPNNVRSRRRSSPNACTRGRAPKKQCSTSAEGTPCPSSLTLISSHCPAGRTAKHSRPALGEDCSPCCTAFSTNG